MKYYTWNKLLNTLQFNKIKGVVLANNAGRLFKNPKFTEGSKLPRYIGECEVDGTKKTVAAWIRNPKNGKPYMYINFGEFKPPVKEKTIPIKSKNKDGIRKIEKIATGKKEEKVKTSDMEVTGIPF